MNIMGSGVEERGLFVVNEQNQLNYVKMPVFCNIYTIIISLFLALFLTIIFILANLSVILFIIPGILFLLTSVLIALIILIDYQSDLRVSSLINQKFPDNLDDSTQIHDAFIIIHSIKDDNGQYAGLLSLLKGFIQKNYPFKIYHCYCPDEFKQVLKNKNAKYIWIFGHGWRGGISFKRRRSLRDRISRKERDVHFPYEELEKEINLYPRKTFIGQFHCNNLPRKVHQNVPLINILLEKPFNESNYFISIGIMNTLSIWYYTRKMMIDISREFYPNPK